MDSSQLAAHWYVDRLTRLGEARHIDALAEDKGVTGTAETVEENEVSISCPSNAGDGKTQEKNTYWNMPVHSPFLTCWPSLTVISQVLTSSMPMPTKHMRPMSGLSASMKMMALVGNVS